MLLNVLFLGRLVAFYHFDQVYFRDPPNNIEQRQLHSVYTLGIFFRTVSSGASPFNRRDILVGPAGTSAVGRLYACLAFFFGGGGAGRSATS